MRIRKRKVPLPLSLLSPVPISDPYLFSRSPVTQQVQGESANTSNTTTHDGHINDGSSQPLDHHLTSDQHRHCSINNDGGNRSSSSSSRSTDRQQAVTTSDLLVKEHLVGCCLGIKLANESLPKSNDASNQVLTASGATAGSDGPSPFSNHGDRAMWRDEDKAIPLKKRRGSFERANTIVDEKQLETNCNNSEEIKEYDREEKMKKMIDRNNDAKSNSDNGASAKKANKRGNTIMEGSRCSRVNGRGWRCCQPTLVGYSLCEHHLGKGRLRSMTCVRGRPSVSSKKAALGASKVVESSPLLQLCEAAKKESETLARNERKAAMAKVKSSTSVGKRVKLGVVKARSLSSLLGRTNNTSRNDSSMNVALEDVEYETNNNMHQG